MGTVYLRNSTVPDSTYSNLAAQMSNAQMDNNLTLFVRNDVNDSMSGVLTMGGNLLPTVFYFNSNTYWTQPATNTLQIWWSASDGWCFYFQNDRNVVLYDDFTAVWSTNTQTSDVRLKENIQPLTNSIEKIKALNPITFTWKAGTKVYDDEVVHEGFIAQEVKNIIPDAVKLMGENYILHKEEIIPVASKALQELIARIEQLEVSLANS